MKARIRQLKHDLLILKIALEKEETLLPEQEIRVLRRIVANGEAILTSL